MTTAYEEALDQHLEFALEEGSLHFEEKSAVHATLRKIAARLGELGIPYAVAGGMALFYHGLRRFTEDVDILITAEGLAAVHRALEGLGYVPLFPGSRALRDAESGVRIEFLVSGEFPGDGKPKPVAFPEPTAASVDHEGVRVVTLEKLIELKRGSEQAGAALRGRGDRAPRGEGGAESRDEPGGNPAACRRNDRR